ncbi:hypothetical protein GQ457_03G023770 [Hibiscus cannabinus]
MSGAPTFLLENTRSTDIVNHGGRPPDIPFVPVGDPTRERDTSPSALDGLRTAKKGRLSGSEQEDSNTHVMEADDELVHTVVNSDNLGEDLRSVESTDLRKMTLPDSYASKVAGSGNKAGANQGPFKDEVEIREEDIIMECDGKIPSIQFSSRVHDQIDNNLKNAIVVRLLGRTIGYKALVNRVNALWKPVGLLQVIDLDNNYFLVRFSAPTDYTKVLTEGPWTIYGSYLTIQPWSRNFLTSEKHPTQVVVWVRLPGLPYRYYTKAVFRHIANLVGKVVRIDYNTDAGERGRFARLAILVDLHKPLLSCIRVDGRIQKLEYEGLHHICYECGVYGHSKESCDTHRTKDKTVTSHMNVDSICAPESENISESNLFGPWMLVADKRRRGVGSRNVPSATPNVASGSRFAGLEVEESGGSEYNKNTVKEAVVGSIRNKQVIEPSVGTGKTFVTNAAYKASYPDKKLRNLKSVSQNVVVPESDKEPLQVVEHNVGFMRGEHRAVIINEHGRTGGSKGFRGDQRRRPVVGSGKIDVSRRHIQMRCGVGARVSGNLSAAEFTHQLTTELDTVGARGLPSSSHNPRLSGELSPMLHSSDEEEFYRSDSPEVLPEGAVFADDHTVFRCYFKEFVREHKPGIVALFEPRISGYGADQVVKRLGFPNSFRVECHGFSGGIWLMWDDSVDIVILKISNQFIHFKVTVATGNVSFLMTAVYASPCSSKCKSLWPQLAALNPGNNVPWLIGGDFNVILSGDERTGGANVHSGGSRLFSDFLFTQGMNDMGFRGPPFTWSRGSLSQRLDRCVVNSLWSASFVTSYVVHLDRLGSDHRPLLGSLGDVGLTACNRPFCFIEAWQTHPQFKEFLCHTWSPKASWSDNVAKFHSDLEIWNKEVFGHLGNRKRRLRARLRGIDRALMTRHSDYLRELAVVLRSELEVVMTQEESFWRQKACSRWVLQGDRNTKFFHTSVMTRRRVNRISALQKDDGSWCTEDAELKEIALKFYGKIIMGFILSNFIWMSFKEGIGMYASNMRGGPEIWWRMHLQRVLLLTT